MGDSRVIVKRFTARLSDGIKRHDELMLAVHGKRVQASLETILVEQFVMSVGVMWEAFLNDLLVAYVLGSPAAYLADLRRRLDQSIGAKFGLAATKLVRFTAPSSLTRLQAVSLLDPKGWNVTASSAADLATRANAMLSARFARRFSLIAEDGEFVDLLVAVRNYLGHRSAASRVALKEAVVKLSGTANGPLKGTLGNVGSYLKVRDTTGRTRAKIIAERVLDVSGRL